METRNLQFLYQTGVFVLPAFTARRATFIADTTNQIKSGFYQTFYHEGLAVDFNN